jgi:hypothetical protein
LACNPARNCLADGGGGDLDALVEQRVGGLAAAEDAAHRAPRNPLLPPVLPRLRPDVSNSPPTDSCRASSDVSEPMLFSIAFSDVTIWLLYSRSVLVSW